MVQYDQVFKAIGGEINWESIMDKFVVRTKLPPRPERKSAVIEDKKKQSTIESLAVRKLISNS